MVEHLNVDDNAAKNFYVIILMVQTKLFLNLYIAKFLNTLVKSFFVCTICTFFMHLFYAFLHISYVLT